MDANQTTSIDTSAQAQEQIAAPAPVKGKGKNKGNKPANKPATTNKPATPALRFLISPDVRPGNGAHLFAHTLAFFKLSGMLQGKTIPGALVTAAMGQTARTYHSKLCRMETTEQGVKLTPSGIAYFNARELDKELHAAYMSILSEGKPHDATGVKNQAFIKAIDSK